MMRGAFIAIVLFFFSAGCTTATLTATPRSATEQLLLSHAADIAISQLEPTRFVGKSVHVDPSLYSSVDKEYVIASLQSALSGSGAFLSDAAAAEIIIVPRSGGLGTDNDSLFLGLPALPISIPGAGALKTPEIALFKIETQTGTSKIRLLAYEADSKRHFSTQSGFGSGYLRKWTILLVTFTTSDVPERLWLNPHTNPVGP